jgi:hypothetical protein
MGKQLIAIEGDVAAQRASLHSFNRADIFEEPVHLSFSGQHLGANRLEKA